MNLCQKLLTTAVLCLFWAPAFAQTTEDVEAAVSKIQAEIAAIRGLDFKRPVKVQSQSLADFGEYLDRMLGMQIGEDLASNYGKVVRKLGLYRGPEIIDLKAMAKKIMQSQAAAYYDPATETFYVVMQGLSEQMTSALYAHELYHGLQDQYFDLNAFILSQHDQLNDDEILARQALVEGEATYLMTLWTLKSALGAIPKPPLLEASINMQSQFSAEQIRNLLKNDATSALLSDDLAKSVDSMDEIPTFMLETLIGAYLKGMRFVFEIQKHGWDEAEKLYSRPPASTEQILHPEKWLAMETPTKFSWPPFEDSDFFQDWKSLETNTLGEIQWRIIFSEFELQDIAESASDGWNGDIYSVLEHSKNGQLLLLLYTSWDSESQAEEFRAAYQKLLKMKYSNGIGANHVERLGNDVLIVEAENGTSVEPLAEFMKQIRREKTDP